MRWVKAQPFSWKAVAMSKETLPEHEGVPSIGIHDYPGTHTTGYNPKGYAGTANGEAAAGEISLEESGAVPLRWRSQE